MAETARDTPNPLPSPTGRSSVRMALRTARDPLLTIAAVAMVLAAVAGVGPFSPVGAPATVLAHLDR